MARALTQSPTQELATIAHALEAKSSGRDKYMARCPAHDDKSPSFSLNIGRNGQPVFYCHAGCTQHEVLSALEDRGLWSPKGQEGGVDPCPYSLDEIDVQRWIIRIACSDIRKQCVPRAADKNAMQRAYSILTRYGTTSDRRLAQELYEQ